MAVEDPVQEVEQEPTRAERRIDHATAKRMFKWSAWLNVGTGAEECSTAVALAAGDAEVPECSNPEHFHAWIRLPNQFQQRDIREKGLASKARRMRQLKDPECDAYDVLEGELAILYDGPKTPLIDEILGREFAEDYPNAVGEVEDEERFEHIARDRERFVELHHAGPDDRNADEFGELERQVNAYTDAVQAKVREVQQPRRDALEDLPLAELVDMIRKSRIEEDAQDEFMHIYNTWEWFAGTYKVRPLGADGRPSERYFPTIDAMKATAPEVIEGLQQTFTDLERAMQQAALGNS